MNFRLLLLFTLFILVGILIFSVSFTDETTKKPLIIVIVENRIEKDLEQSLEIYQSDLKKENFDVIINSEFDSASHPSKIKKFLKEEYSKNKNLKGAVLVGNIPSILFNNLEDQGSLYWHDYLADYYYMDLNGEWSDSDSNGVFNEHKDTDSDFLNRTKELLDIKSNLNPEIWVSRLRADKLISLGSEITLLKNYFRKNHDYRTGVMELPQKKAFIVSAAIDVERSDWGARPNEIYSNVDVVNRQLHMADSLRSFLSSDEGYEFGIVNVFSGPRIHHFNYFNTGLDSTWWKMDQGEEFIVKYSDEVINTSNFTWLDVKKIEPNVLFYHLLCSETGRYDYPDYLAGSFIFSGKGLVAIAGTQHSGSVGVPILYESLDKGKTFGTAWKEALNYIVNNIGEDITVYFGDDEQIWTEGRSLYKAVLIGDGTLKLPNSYYSNATAVVK